ncbi:MAG: CPBP family glutamic-type intramembrane protease [Chthoniobacterales bacterium]
MENPRDPAPAPRTVPWGEVALFFVVATAVSAPFRLGWVDWREQIALPYGLSIFFRVCRGMGPAVGYLVMYHVVKSKVPRPFTFFGNSAAASVAAASVIPAGLALGGLANEISPHYAGFLTGISLTLYALGEEYGWRGYLQQALEPLRLPLRIFVIATLWYLWHLNFLIPGISIPAHLIHYGGLLLGSWGLLKISKVTGAILFAAAVHLSFNLFFDVNASMGVKLSVLAACGLIWTALILSSRMPRSQD